MLSTIYKILSHFLSITLDFIFPPSKRTLRVKKYKTEMLIPSLSTYDALGIKITTLANYKQGELKDTITSLKYERSAHAADLLAGLLADYLLEQLAEDEIFSDTKPILVPIPLAKVRERERGFNQITEVLKLLPKYNIHLEVRPDILLRTKNTRPQTRLPRKERLLNVKGAFSLNKDVDIKGMHILLIDDVTTTGATLFEATKILEKAGAKVTPVAFSHSK